MGSNSHCQRHAYEFALLFSQRMEIRQLVGSSRVLEAADFGEAVRGRWLRASFFDCADSLTVIRVAEGFVGSASGYEGGIVNKHQ
jgi:hypothetical protein